MAKKKNVKKSPKQLLVAEATQLNWQIKGKLKSEQIHYLQIAGMLITMRDRKLYAALNHASLEEYAEEHLGMQRSSLYKYLQVRAWVSEFHREWLQPKPKGFIPELNDVEDLMWIERKLTEKGLSKKTRIELTTMRNAALQGRLRDKDLEEWRKQGSRAKDNALKSFLSRIRSLRNAGAELKNMPSDAIQHIDAAIESIRKAAQSAE